MAETTENEAIGKEELLYPGVPAKVGVEEFPTRHQYLKPSVSKNTVVFRTTVHLGVSVCQPRQVTQKAVPGPWDTHTIHVQVTVTGQLWTDSAICSSRKFKGWEWREKKKTQLKPHPSFHH